jgi:Fur family peroxide stress response transcriptional regulator
MKFLADNTSHPSAEEIHEALSGQFPTLSLATVYNTLEALRERGDIIEIGADFDKKRFDRVTKSHHHLICIRCHKILDVPERFNPVLTEAERKGFQVIRSQVDFHGLCPQCQGHNKNKNQ